MARMQRTLTGPAGLDRRQVMAGAAMAAGTAFGGLAAFAQGAAGTIKLRLMETTDIHMHVAPYDYYRDSADDTVGLAKTAALIAKARTEARNSLLFDNGDFIQGNPMGDLIAFERGLKAGEAHPMIRAMNQLKYDVATLGNHEFNYGLPFLDTALSGAEFALVLANLHKGQAGANPRADQTYLKPYVILERAVTDEAGQAHQIKIGVIGFTPPQIMQWDQAHLRGKVNARDIIETARAYVPEMRERGCDLVVALCHSGIGNAAPQGNDENASLLLSRVPGIDVIFMGHSHQLFPSPAFQNVPGADIAKSTLNGIPAVMPGFWGSHLGIVDFTLQKDGGKFRVVDFKVEAPSIFRREQGKVTALAEPVEAMLSMVKPDHEQTLAYIRKPVGRTARRLDSYFSLVTDSPALQVISDAQIWYARQLLAGTPHASLPLLSAIAPFKAGGRGGPNAYSHVEPGEMALKNVADIYVFPNTLKAVKLNGAGLKDWLERSAGQFNQIKATDAEQPLVNSGFPTFNFDIIDGVTYKIDVSQPDRFDKDGKLADANASRIADLAYNGQPVRPDQEFIIVSNNYRAGGGGNFAGLNGSQIVLDAPDYTRDIIIKFLMQAGTIDPRPDNNWGFKPVPGATNVVFESSPKARAYLAEIPHVKDAGDAAGGFAKFRIELGK